MEDQDSVAQQNTDQSPEAQAKAEESPKIDVQGEAVEPASPASSEKAESKEEVKVSEEDKEPRDLKEPETLKEEKAPEEDKPTAGEEPEPGKRQWYVIQTFSGQEGKVRSAIARAVEQYGMQNKILNVLVPEEEVIEVVGGKRAVKNRKMFPGYVFLDMILDNESWYMVRQIPGVAKFIGTKNAPTPVLDREMQRILKQLGVKAEKLEVTFEVGEAVRIISGPFRGYTGSVGEVNQERGKLKVLVNIFGRDTPVEVNFEHSERVT